MYDPKPSFFCCLLLLLSVALPLSSQENHRNEPATGILLTRSTFAHGYRHGYEQGYHQGNIDINMARPARKKFSEFRGVPLGYQSDFGPRNSFLYGFQFGLMAGYSAGYSGKQFRAVSNLRQAAMDLNPTATETQAPDPIFDKGVIFGYEDGFGWKPAKTSGAGSGRPTRGEACQTSPKAQQQTATESQEYCEGYRRGLVLGRADASAAGAEHGLLEASK
jgi:flagellar biosynthesis/type III secretory pathway protein FliH